MPLIHSNQHLKRFKELVSNAKKIDIAVAWATSCDEINVLANSNAKIRAVVGTSGNSTQPSTLRRLVEFAELRIPPHDPGQIFHPKYYVFHGDTTFCWVGSANLSNGGFGRNIELIHEFKLNSRKDQTWFERLWKGLNPDPMPAIKEYEKRYTPQERIPRPASRPRIKNLPKLAEIKSWDHFVKALRQYDQYFRNRNRASDVLGETHSYLHTIYSGREILLRNNWTNLTQRECNILCGRNNQEGIWAALGWVRGGGAYIFNPGT